jgi:hypothetical protein
MVHRMLTAVKPPAELLSATDFGGLNPLTADSVKRSCAASILSTKARCRALDHPDPWLTLRQRSTPTARPSREKR